MTYVHSRKGSAPQFTSPFSSPSSSFAPENVRGGDLPQPGFQSSFTHLALLSVLASKFPGGKSWHHWGPSCNESEWAPNLSSRLRFKSCL